MGFQIGVTGHILATEQMVSMVVALYMDGMCSMTNIYKGLFHIVCQLRIL